MSTTSSRSRSRLKFLATSVALTALMSFTPKLWPKAWAAPNGGQVTNGSANIQTSGGTTTINQSSDRATINWQSFNLAQNETANFNVPSPTSATLNRITGGALTTISGNINSNGTLYFSNPNGLIFDATSRVTANGFHATTANRSAIDSPAGNLGSGGIVLNGYISAPRISASGGTVSVRGNLVADGGVTESGGSVSLSSDSNTDFSGRISAQGGATAGDGGSVQISGKNNLNFTGAVSTLAAKGKAGSLQLNSSNILIGSFPALGVSYVSAASLQTALASGNVVINAQTQNALSQGLGGNGRITVIAALTWTSTNSLTLSAGRGGIRINTTISGTSSSWESNLFLNSRGEIYITPGADWTLGGTVRINNAVGGKFVRIDLAGHRLLGAKIIWVNAQNLYYTGATTGNNATIELSMDKGSFTFVNDKRSVTTATTLTNASTSADWGTGLGTLTSGTPSGGLTVGGVIINNQGVVYGGSVTIDGVTTGAASNLRYIEGTGVAVTKASVFSGSLTLVDSGAGISRAVDGDGILIEANLTTGSDLTLVQSGNLRLGGYGINIWSSTLTVGSIMTLIQSGSAGQDGIYVGFSTLRAGGAITISQSGSTGHYGIYVNSSTLKAGGAMIISQLGSAAQDGIRAYDSTLTAEGDLSLLQNGSVGSGYGGIFLESFGTGQPELSLAAGANSFLTLKTNNNNLLLSWIDDFQINRGKLRIDLGTGAMVSVTPMGSIPSGGYTLKARGLDVFYTGATTGNIAKIDVGSGSFTYVNDKRSVTAAVTLTDTTSSSDATNGWGAAPNFGGSLNARTLGGLTIIGTSDTISAGSGLTGLGVVYGDTVTINGVTTTGAASNLRYIEGTGVGVLTSASVFSGSLTLVGSGAGITAKATHYANHDPFTAAVLINANLTTTNGGDLTLINNDVTNAYGILTLDSVITAAGSMTLTQTGRVGVTGLDILASTLTAAGSMTLTITQSGGSWSQGIVLGASNLTAGSDLSLIQIGSVDPNNSRFTTCGITFEAGSWASARVSLASGSESFVTIKTKNENLWINGGDNFQITRGRVRIDLGTGTIVADGAEGVDGNILNANGLDVYYTGASSGSRAKIKAASFTVVTKVAGGQTLAAAPSVQLSDYSGWVINSATNKAITSIGAGLATDGVLTIDAATSGGYSYLEGATIVGAAAPGLGAKITSIVGKEIYAGVGIATPVTPVVSVTPVVPVAPVAPVVPLGFTISSDILWDGSQSTETGTILSSIFAAKGASGITLTIGAGGKLRLLNVKAVSSLLSFSLIKILGGGEFIIGGQGVQLSGGVTIDASATGAVFTQKEYAAIRVNNDGWSAAATGRTTGLSIKTGAQPLVISAPILVTNGDLTLASIGPITAKGSYLRIDLGTGKLLGGRTISTSGKDAFFTGASTGNNATFNLGSGNFVYVTDYRAITSPITINNSTKLPSAYNLAASGLTVTTSGSTSGQGLVYGDTVTINGVTATGAASHLRYIEGTGVLVNTTASVFTGSLILVGSGAGISDGTFIAGVLINTNLTTNNGGDLTLVQSGNVVSVVGTRGYGISVSNSTLTAGGSMSLIQSGSAESTGIDVYGSTLTAGGAMTLIQSGSANFTGFDVNDSTLTAVGAMSLVQSGSIVGTGIEVDDGSTMTAGGDMTLVQSGRAWEFGIVVRGTLTAGGAMTFTQSGSAGQHGIWTASSTLTAGGALTLIQSGSAVWHGIIAGGSTLTAGSELSLLQTGSVGSGYYGISFYSELTAANKGVSLAAGTGSFVTLKTNNKNLSLVHFDRFQITSGRVRIDLGTGAMVSESPFYTIPAGGFTLNAAGLDVYYTGASNVNSAKINSGSFTVVSKTSGDQTLATVASVVVSDYSGLVINSATNAAITSIGAGLASDGVLTIGPATSGGYSYLEGATIVGAAAPGLGAKITRFVGKEIYAGVGIATPVAPTPSVPPVVAEPAPPIVVPPVAAAPTPVVPPVVTEPAPPIVVPPVAAAPTPAAPPVVAEPAPTPVVPPVVAEPAPTPVVPPVVVTPTVVSTAPLQKPSYSVSYIIDNPSYGQTRAGTVLDWTTAGITSIVTKTVNGVSTSVSYQGVSIQLSHNAVDYGTILYKAPYALYYTQKTGALWTPVITSDGNLIQKTDLVVPTKK